jgi:uncharacterized protein YmfQ (DUF2313 family)
MATVTRTQRMVEAAPSYYHYSKIYERVQEAIALDLDTLETKGDDLQLQLYVKTATWGLKYWEQAVGILPIETDTYETRRTKIINKLSGAGNFSADMVYNIAKEYTQGEVVIDFEPSTENVVVEFIEDYPTSHEYRGSLEEIIHAHLKYRYKNSFKAKTKPKTDWKQKIDKIGVNLNLPVPVWGYRSSGGILNGETYLDGVYLLNGGSGPTAKIGPNMHLYFQLTQTLKHKVTRNQVVAMSFPFQSSTAFSYNQSVPAVAYSMAAKLLLKIQHQVAETINISTADVVVINQQTAAALNSTWGTALDINHAGTLQVYRSGVLEGEFTI